VACLVKVHMMAAAWEAVAKVFTEVAMEVISRGEEATIWEEATTTSTITRLWAVEIIKVEALHNMEVVWGKCAETTTTAMVE